MTKEITQNKLSKLTYATAGLFLIQGISPVLNYNVAQPTFLSQDLQIPGVEQYQTYTMLKQTKLKRRRLFGSLKGKVTINENFDKPLPENIINSYYGE
ncbi:MAG: hypothetical protein QG673_1119 [Pseudomonadota bacterium]|nr:hypothetical protein [Pseudomonadota bacterium]